MNKLGLLFLTLIFLVFTNTKAFACVCFGPENPKENLEWADAVFSGKVVSVEDGNYTFEVGRVWKGISEAKVVIKDYEAGSDCASNFQLGEQYVVFAYIGKTDKILTYQPCNWNQKLAKAKKIFRAIGKGKLVKDVEKKPAAKSTSWRRIISTEREA